MSETLGRYRLLKRIAAGGMAEIWLAKQAGAQGFEKLVVVKRILEHLAHDEQFVEMFLDEARLAALLAHPNIVQIFDLGGDEGGWYIAMEHIHGENLRVILRRRQLNGTPGFPLNIAVRAASHTCQALCYAHVKKGLDGSPLNIVHRDVSPQNILISYEGQVKVVDFGIAKAATQNQVTRTGIIKGKFAYMSPEQCLGKRLDGRSDQFAVGSVLWELLTGVRLFERENEILTFKAITEEEVPSPRSIKPEIPEDLEAVVMRALSRDPDARYPDCQAMHTDLERFLQREGELVSPVEIADFMEGLFQDRLEGWREVVELAREGKSVDSGLLEGRSDLFEMSLTPSSARIPPGPARDEAVSRKVSIEEEVGAPEDPAGGGAEPLSPEAFRGSGAGPAREKVRTDVAHSTTIVPTNVVSPPPTRGRVLDSSEEATRLQTIEEIEAASCPAKLGDESTSIRPREDPGPASASKRRFGIIPVAGIALASLAVAGYWFGIGPGRTAGGLPVDEDGTAAEVATGQVAPGEAGEPEEGAASEPERAPSTAPSPSPEEGKAIASEAPPTAPPPHDEEAVTEPPETLETEPSVADSSRPSGREPGTRDRPPRQPRAERRPPRVRDAEPAPTRNDRTTRTTREEPVQTKLALAVPASPGTFSLNSRPWCRAYLGARELGVTPISAVEVPAGRHTVRCVHPELGERSIQLNVPPGEEVRQSIAWLGELRFRVLPWAMVHVNGEEIGMTPLPPRELPAGRYRVRLVNEQLGVDRTMQIEIRGGETATVDVDLR